MLGFSDTLALTAVLTAYLFLCALPAYLWSRSSYFHPFWRGVESFVCYLLVALVLGGVLAASDDSDWSITSGIAAGGDAWARIGSIVVLLAVFVLASWWGGKSAAGRRQRLKSKNRRKKKLAP